MALLSAQVRLQVAERLRPMTEDVTLLVVHRGNTQDPHEKENAEVLQGLAQELSEVSEHLHLKVLDAADPEAAGLDLPRFPALLLLDSEGQNRNVLFSGVPGGYEFATLLEDILDLGAKRPLLSPASLEKLAAINSKVHIMVFTTPTCPYCPRAVRLAHQMAMVNPNITGEMVDAQSFMDLSREYQVYGVPKTVVNYGAAQFEGAVPEQVFVEQVLRGARGQS